MSLWKSIRHKLQVAGQFSGRDWLGLVQAWWVLLGFRLALRLTSLERLEAFTRPAPGESPQAATALAWAWQRQRWISRAAGVHLLPMTCLPRALSLRWMCSRHAIRSALCIGMNKTPQGMAAHAWVEVGGMAVGEPGDISERFTILERGIRA